MSIRYLSLFSGIEAATQAWHPLGWQCVGVSEIESFPCELLRQKYPHIPNLGDITKITEADIIMLGKIDLIVFGSPCQDLSVAGKRKGLAGERSGLFHAAMQIVQWAREWCDLRGALWENVPGAFTSNAGADFAVVVGELAGLDATVPPKGWGTEGCAVGTEAMVEWATLDAQWFGVPQRRRRVFALADFGDWAGRPPVLLEPQGMRGDSAPSRGPGEAVAGTLASRTGAGGYPGSDEACDGHVIPVPQQRPVLSAFGGNNTSAAIDVAPALLAQAGWKGDFESETFVMSEHQVVSTLDASFGRLRGCSGQNMNHGHSHLVTVYMSSRTFGADGGINEHFAQREVCDALHTASGHGNKAPLLATCVTGDVTHALNTCNNGKGSSEDGTGRGTPIIGFHYNAQAAQLPSEGGHALRDADALTCSQGAGVAQGMAVRRLTPRECERLQGMADDYTAIRVGKKPAADGPRYKALGNSMAVPVMSWIGRQIDFAWRFF